MQRYIMRGEYDLEIDLTLLTPEEGGRRSGFRSGYRRTIYIAGCDYVAEFHLSDQDRYYLYPGETCRVLVCSTAPLLHNNRQRH